MKADPLKTLEPGERIKQWRTGKKLTQEGAAAELGVNLRSLQNWEGGRKPSAAVWALLEGRLV